MAKAKGTFHEGLHSDRNGLSYDGKTLSNWRIFIGDFDKAMRNGRTLVDKAQSPAISN